MDAKRLLNGIGPIVGNHKWSYLDVFYEEISTGKREVLTYTIPDDKTEAVIEYIKTGMLIYYDPDIVICLINIRHYTGSMWNGQEIYNQNKTTEIRLNQKTKEGEWIV